MFGGKSAARMPPRPRVGGGIGPVVDGLDRPAASGRRQASSDTQSPGLDPVNAAIGGVLIAELISSGSPGYDSGASSGGGGSDFGTGSMGSGC